MKTESIKKEIAGLNRTTIYINLFNLDYNTKEADIRDFYKAVNLAYVNMKQISKGVADIELRSKEEALKLVEIGRGVQIKFSFFEFKKY